MLFSNEEFFFKKNGVHRGELFDCGVSDDMPKVTHQLVCIVLTLNVFVLLVQFTLVHLKI